MQCRVCGTTFSDEEARCPKCGFPAIQMLGADGDTSAADKAVDTYRGKLLNGYSLEITMYGYEREGGRLSFKEQKDITIAY